MGKSLVHRKEQNALKLNFSRTTTEKIEEEMVRKLLLKTPKRGNNGVHIVGGLKAVHLRALLYCY